MAMRTSTPIRLLVAASTVWAAAALPAGSVGAAPAQAEPEITAGPATGLLDGQPVTVTGRGFAPHQRLTIYQCVSSGFLGYVDCDLGTARQTTTAADGTVSTTMAVYAVVDTWGTATGFLVPGPGQGVDCRESPGRCMLATEASFQDLGSAVTAPLAFDAGADEHRPSITVSPGDGLVDRQLVRVEGRGFVRSERPLVRIYQCHTDPELGERCGVPVQTAELDQDGAFAAGEVPVLTTGTDAGEPFDCRARACYVKAVAAGRIGTPRTAASAPVAFDPDAVIPDWPAPQLTVTPTTGLADGDVVTVQGSGFTPGGVVNFVQCPGGDDFERCFLFISPIATPSADARGMLDAEVAVQSILSLGVRPDDPPGSDRFDCRQAAGCVLVAWDREFGDMLTTPISFRGPQPGTRRYLEPVFDEVDVIRDIVYRETVDHRGNPVQLTLDLYVPRGDTATSRPATVWLSGGWFRGISDMGGYATSSARYGQVGVDMEYRVRPDALSWRDMYLASLDAYDDTTAGVEWLQAHAAEYGIDPDAISAGGYSAGAVTAVNLAYLPGQRGPTTSRIAAAIPDSGLMYTPPERGEPPTIAFHGSLDRLTPYDNMATLCPQAALVDVPCELVTAENFGHGGATAEFFPRSSAFVAEHVLGPLGYFDVTADAGGPYEVEEGSTVALDATGSAGDDLAYAWSPAELVDDPGSPTATIVGLDDGTETLGLTVTNRHGVTDQTETQLSTTNVAPSLDTFALRSGQTPRGVALDASVTDPGSLDTHTATVDWGDGTIESATVQQEAGRATVLGRHTYARPGRYEVTLTVADDDGGTDELAASIVVTCPLCPPVQPDPSQGGCPRFWWTRGPPCDPLHVTRPLGPR